MFLHYMFLSNCHENQAIHPSFVYILYIYLYLYPIYISSLQRLDGFCLQIQQPLDGEQSTRRKNHQARETQGGWPFTCTFIPKDNLKRLIDIEMYVFGQWEKAGMPKDNPCMLREKTPTPCCQSTKCATVQPKIKSLYHIWNLKWAEDQQTENEETNKFKWKRLTKLCLCFWALE